MAKHSGIVLAALCVGALQPRTAAAEDDNSAETAAARGLALDGIKLADAGRCAEAVDKLARAEKLHHGVVVLGRLGECQVAIGKLVEGTETLRKVLREPLPANATALHVKAHERAQSVLDGAKPRIAAMIIVVKGPPSNASVSVTFDGQPMPVALLDAERPTDPGEHFVEASAVGFLKASARVSVLAGDKQNLTLRLDPDPNAAAGAPSPIAASDAPGASARSSAGVEAGAPPSAPALAAARSERSEPDRTGAYVAWAAGGAALAGGAIFGALAFKGKSDLDKQCSDNICPDTSQDRLDSARRSSTVSTILFGVGGAGIALGTILYFTAGPSSSGRASTQPADRAPGSLQARAYVGIGRIGLAGEF